MVTRFQAMADGENGGLFVYRQIILAGWLYIYNNDTGKLFNYRHLHQIEASRNAVRRPQSRLPAPI
jgi:hypothetical protein